MSGHWHWRCWWSALGGRRRHHRPLVCGRGNLLPNGLLVCKRGTCCPELARAERNWGSRASSGRVCCTIYTRSRAGVFYSVHGVDLLVAVSDHDRRNGRLWHRTETAAVGDRPWNRTALVLLFFWRVFAQTVCSPTSNAPSPCTIYTRNLHPALGCVRGVVFVFHCGRAVVFRTHHLVHGCGYGCGGGHVQGGGILISFVVNRGPRGCRCWAR